MNSYDYKVTDVATVDGVVVSATFTVTVSDGVDSFTHSYQTAFKNYPVTPIDVADLAESKVVEWIKRNVKESVESSADAELAAFKERKSVQHHTLNK